MPSKSQTAKRKQNSAQATVEVKQPKKDAKQSSGLAKKIVITVICVILALAMTIPSLVLLFSR